MAVNMTQAATATGASFPLTGSLTFENGSCDDISGPIESSAATTSAVSGNNVLIYGTNFMFQGAIMDPATATTITGGYQASSPLCTDQLGEITLTKQPQ
jgi:hypothetical protein